MYLAWINCVICYQRMFFIDFCWFVYMIRYCRDVHLKCCCWNVEQFAQVSVKAFACWWFYRKCIELWRWRDTRSKKQRHGDATIFILWWASDSATPIFDSHIYWPRYAKVCLKVELPITSGIGVEYSRVQVP